MTMSTHMTLSSSCFAFHEDISALIYLTTTTQPQAQDTSAKQKLEAAYSPSTTARICENRCTIMSKAVVLVSKRKLKTIKYMDFHSL